MVKSLQLNNFKIFSDKTFFFTNRIEITGSNGTGKTTIAEAIVFVLYNRTLNGGKNTDIYIKKGADLCEVVIETNQGKIKRRRGKQSRVWFNEQEINQEELEKKLNLPDFEIFNSIFNVGYFMTLDENTQRQIILDLTEEIDMVDLFKKMSGKEEYLTDYQIELTELEKAYKHVNAEKLQLQTELTMVKGEKDVYIKELAEINIQNPEPLEKQKSKIQNLININSQEIEEFNKYEKDYEVYARFEGMRNQKERLGKWLKENPLKVIPKSINLQKEKEELLKSFVKVPQGLNCPVCKQKISAKYKTEIKDNNNFNQKRLDQIERTLKKIDELEKYNRTVMAMQNQYDLIEIPNIIKPVKPNITNDIKEQTQKLQNELKQIEEMIYETKNQLKRKNGLESQIAKHQEIITNLESKLVDLKQLVEILSPKGLPNEEMRVKLQPLKDRLSKEIPGIDIQLLELLKSEMGWRKVFNLLVNDIHYRKLSTGERKKIDISLSLILNDMLKEKFDNPINILFVDNTESLSQIINFNNNSIQIFLSEVSDNELIIKTL